MKKMLNTMISVLAVGGIVLMVGSVGNQDYAVEMGQVVSLSETILPLFISVAFMIPAIIREVL